ncbi:MAG: 50S ribosomal protein L25, partial [Candidatus Rokuibacteriota bacterium]
MPMPELTIKQRTETGKQIAKRLRREGVVPAVIYGGAKSEPVVVDPKAVLRIIHGREGSTQLLNLTFESGGSRMAIIRDLQFDPVSEQLLHVDLQEVTADRPITVRVAVHPVGEAAGVREQKGILNVVLHELDVSCLPTMIPERIDADVSALMIGDVL